MAAESLIHRVSHTNKREQQKNPDIETTRLALDTDNNVEFVDSAEGTCQAKNGAFRIFF